MSRGLIFQNGNANVSIYSDGTRIVEYDNKIQLEYPLNIDIKVSSKCSLGMNHKTGKAYCDFCHESASTSGVECDYSILSDKLKDLPKGIELAIGANSLTDGLSEFIQDQSILGRIVNITMNQLHLNDGNADYLFNHLILEGYIAGVGISFRDVNKLRKQMLVGLTEKVLVYPNTVMHVIVGIDSIDDICNLHGLGVRKILCLGEKNFGLNTGKVDLNSRRHKEWYWKVHELFDKFEIVSFDNLALEQLNIRRFHSNKSWDKFYQSEHSMYINAVEGIYMPSSRNNQFNMSWDEISLKDYFLSKQLISL